MVSQLAGYDIERHEGLSSREDGISECKKASCALLWEAILAGVPVGYEDQMGFHWGTEFASYRDS